MTTVQTVVMILFTSDLPPCECGASSVTPSQPRNSQDHLDDRGKL